MVASAVYITDLKGKVIINRNYRGDIQNNIIDKFTKYINEEDESALTPFLTIDSITYIYIKHKNLFLVAVTKFNANAMAILNFLYRVVEVFEDYFNELMEESIRDNFVLIYELLDEMMDFGYPQTTEPKVLKDFICISESHKLAVATPPVAITNAVSWRNENIKYKKNEVFLDVVEKLNLLVASNGTVLRSEILGALKMKSFLSGMPELKLGLNDRILMESKGVGGKGKGIELEDIRFHQCVRLSRFEHDRTISFIPPDGEFDLMTYRLNTTVRPLIWIESHIERYSSSRIEYVVKARSNYKRRSMANNVEIVIQVPNDADTPNFKTTIGKVDYVPDKDCIIWRIKQFPGQKEFLMKAQFGLPSITGDNANIPMKAPISVNFEIPYFTVSGIQVRYLKIIEKSGYQALPWVRYITQNGDYQIRMN